MAAQPKFVFTPAEAAEQASDQRKAAAYASAGVAEFQRLTADGEKATTVAALVTFAATQSGLLHVGRETAENPKREGQQGLTEYATAFVTSKKPDGYSKAAATGWMVAGRAFTVHGVDPESDLGKDLVARYAQMGPVRKVIESPLKTDAIRKIQAAVDKKKAAEAHAKQVASDKREAEKAAEPVKMPVDVKGAVEVIQQILAALTVDEATDVLGQVGSWFEAEGTDDVEVPEAS